MLIAQLTDLHVRPRGRVAYERVDTNAMLEAAIGHLSALDPGPDAVLMTGDLTDCGLVPEYEMLRELIAPLDAPVYLVPGNHDRRENLRAVFADAGYLPADGEFLQFTVEDHPVRLIGLDTVVPGQGYGEMCAERLAWLDARLAEAPERPTVLFLHHPPFATGIPAMDEIGCRNAAAFGAVVARYPAIERVLCGHHHRPIQARWHGTLASVAPSTAHQVELDLAGRGKARFNMEPPGYQLHLWQDGGGLSSHTVHVGSFDGPYPFLLDADYPAFAAGS